MTKVPTKEQFKTLLKQEIKAWSERVNELEGELKEQAIGRKSELVWLLSVYEGKAEMPDI